MNKAAQLMKQRGWDATALRDESIIARNKLSYGTCYTVETSTNWPTDGVNMGTIKKVAATLGVDWRDLISNNGTE